MVLQQNVGSGFSTTVPTGAIALNVCADEGGPASVLSELRNAKISGDIATLPDDTAFLIACSRSEGSVPNAGICPSCRTTVSVPASWRARPLRFCWIEFSQ